MFIRYYLELSLPFADAERAMLADPTAWVSGLAVEAEDRGERLLAEVGFDLGEGRRVDRQVEIEVGEPVALPSKTVLPLSWAAATAESAFPRLDADIELAPLGPSRSQLSISARYRPPFGVVGRALDRALLHRVAEATIKDFLDHAGERIATSVAAQR